MHRPQGWIEKEGLKRGDWCFVIAWTVWILLIYALGGYFGVRLLQSYKMQTREHQQAWMRTFTGPGQDTSLPVVGAGRSEEPVDVYTAVSFNRISDIELREANWTAEFDVWFRWERGSVDPGRNLRIVNGTILEKEKTAAGLRNGVHYEQYRLKARISKVFDAARFPFSNEGLAIALTDGIDGTDRLRFVRDGRGIDISHLVLPQGIRIRKEVAVVGLQRYGTGEAGHTGTDRTHSVLVAGLLVVPPSGAVYLKLFQALYASVAITLIVFFIKPIHVDPRFGLAVGAFFAAVGNNISVVTLIPPSEHISLANIVNGVGLATIFLALAQSAVSLHIMDTMGKERLSRVFDMASFAALFIGYGAINLILPLAARS